MLVKSRSESLELVAMRYLASRVDFSEQEKYQHVNLEKGYEGEVKFDQLAESLLEERYVINDLLLEVNNSYFQIDTLLISQTAIHLLDIKNYQGDYYIEGDKLYSVTTRREWKNPIDQLKRSATLFRQLLQKLEMNYHVEASVIFINPEFTLYQAPLELPIVFPTQVNRFLKDLNITPSKLNNKHQQLSQKLLSLHQINNPHSKFPRYTYEQLRKGVFCNSCRSLLLSKTQQYFLCTKCGSHEKIEQAILRNIEEFKVLFPERLITTQSIHDWCEVDLCKKTIRRILKKHYTPHGVSKDTYYM